MAFGTRPRRERSNATASQIAADSRNALPPTEVARRIVGDSVENLDGIELVSWHLSPDGILTVLWLDSVLDEHINIRHYRLVPLD